MDGKATLIAQICKLLASGDHDHAAARMRSEYPFVPPAIETRTCRDSEALEVFMRDGFIDRYSGGRLVFPGVLRVVSLALPSEFPYHPNWKQAETHPAFWELCPTIDHLVPIARGGRDDQSNRITTSMIRNSAKGNWLLEELGWQLHPPGSLDSWDGLLTWFLSYVNAYPPALQCPYIRRWYHTATSCAAV